MDIRFYSQGKPVNVQVQDGREQTEVVSIEMPVSCVHLQKSPTEANDSAEKGAAYVSDTSVGALLIQTD